MLRDARAAYVRTYIYIYLGIVLAMPVNRIMEKVFDVRNVLVLGF